MVVVGKRAEEEGGEFKMDVKLLSKKNEKLVFSIKGEDASFVNALRRYMLVEVPTMAIESVEFRKNNSILYDEMIAHRLGLVPLKTDLKSYVQSSKCKCKGAGCAKCTLKLTLKSGKTVGFIYASQIKSKDPKVKPVYPKTPIAKLIENQDLVFEATAVLGSGKDHMKFSPCLAFFRHNPNIVIKKNPVNAEKIVEQCPVDIFDIKSGKLTINKTKITDCHLCNACVDLADGAVEINKEDNYVVHVESWGQLDPKDIVKTAITVFDEQIDEFVGLVKTVK